MKQEYLTQVVKLCPKIISYLFQFVITIWEVLNITTLIRVLRFFFPKSTIEHELLILILIFWLPLTYIHFQHIFKLNINIHKLLIHLRNLLKNVLYIEKGQTIAINLLMVLIKCMYHTQQTQKLACLCLTNNNKNNNTEIGTIMALIRT